MKKKESYQEKKVLDIYNYAKSETKSGSPSLLVASSAHLLMQLLSHHDVLSLGEGRAGPGHVCPVVAHQALDQVVEAALQLGILTRQLCPSCHRFIGKGTVHF